MDILNLNEFEIAYITGMLLSKAFENSGFEIEPCNCYTTFSSGLMFYNNSVFLYYNAKDTKSTHLVKMTENELLLNE